MIKIEFYKKGTIVYSIYFNKIEKYIVDDVNISIKNDIADISYSLIAENGKNTKMPANILYDDINILREEINKQFEQLIPKNIGECKKEKTE